MFTRWPRSRPSFASSSTPDDRVSAVAFFALRAARISSAWALASLRASPAERFWSSSFQAAAGILSPVIRRTCLWKSGASVRAAVSKRERSSSETTPPRLSNLSRRESRFCDPSPAATSPSARLSSPAEREALRTASSPSRYSVMTASETALLATSASVPSHARTASGSPEALSPDTTDRLTFTARASSAGSYDPPSAAKAFPGSAEGKLGSRSIQSSPSCVRTQKWRLTAATRVRSSAGSEMGVPLL